MQKNARSKRKKNKGKNKKVMHISPDYKINFDTSSEESSSDDESVVYSVKDINIMIKNLFTKELGDLVSVEGEISNYKLTNNNLFMTLKDNSSRLSVVCWGYGRNSKNPELDNGKQIIVTGILSVWNKLGKYQLEGKHFELVGIGDIYAEYEKLKKLCYDRGYFDESHKKSVPKHIKKIGLITSKKGDAIKDFLSVLERYQFKGKIYVKNCYVQGTHCPSSVVKAIKELDKLDLDVIVITRGGGAFEDLFGFSNIRVVKTIYHAKTFILSAIGHVKNEPLSDRSSDLRCGTPSIAGEYLGTYQQSKYDITKYTNYTNLLKLQIVNDISKYKSQLTMMKNKMDMANPDNVIKDGYCILSRHNRIYNKISRLKRLKKRNPDLKLKLRFLDGYGYIKINELKLYKYN